MASESGLISHREYARRRGLSHQAVSKAVRAGRIPTVDGKIDPAVADEIWAQNTRPRADMKLTGDPLDTENGHDAAALERPRATFIAARALREVYAAKRAKAEFEEIEGKLVPVEEVREIAFKTSRAMRDQLLALPSRLAPVLYAAQDVAECHEILEAALLEVCAGLGSVNGRRSA